MSNTSFCPQRKKEIPFKVILGKQKANYNDNKRTGKITFAAIQNFYRYKQDTRGHTGY